MASGVIHGRLGALYLSTAAGSTSYGTLLGYTDNWSITPSKDLVEITKLDQNSKEYLEGLIGGSVSVGGSFRVADTILHKVINRFAVLEIDTSSGGRDDFADGTMYLHCIVKSIDTAKSSDNAKGAKFVVPVLLSGMSMDASAGDVEKWSADGSVDGDLLYVESSSTARGIPKVV